MPKNIIIHTADISIDGSGDLIYYLNWLKVFHRFFQGSHQQLVLLFADDIDNVTEHLIALSKTEPKHPIFNYLAIANGSIKPIILANQKIGLLVQPQSRMAMLDITRIFPHLTSADIINVFKISVSGNMLYKNLGSGITVDQLFGIFEFDALPTQLKRATYSTLGLGANDFGLLHDLDGITGTEDLDFYLDKLAPTTKQLIFQDANISNVQAKEQLCVPSVFGYLFPLYNSTVLEAALHSPIIQQAIAQGQKPLFFITHLHEGLILPAAIQQAASKGQIRVVTSWVPSVEINAVNAIFMNRMTNSIIMPSGDNSLTLCIKTGKFPLYSHKQLPDFMQLLMPKDSKLGIFKSMLKILNDHAAEFAWDKMSGFHDCKRVLTYLSQATHNTKHAASAAKSLHLLLTSDMLSFFSSQLAPFIMQHHAFENRTLPKLLGMIKSVPAPAPIANTTQQFAGFKAQAQTTNVKQVAQKQEGAKTAFAGLKPGFLL